MPVVTEREEGARKPQPWRLVVVLASALLLVMVTLAFVGPVRFTLNGRQVEIFAGIAPFHVRNRHMPWQGFNQWSGGGIPVRRWGVRVGNWVYMVTRF